MTPSISPARSGCSSRAARRRAAATVGAVKQRRPWATAVTAVVVARATSTTTIASPATRAPPARSRTHPITTLPALVGMKGAARIGPLSAATSLHAAPRTSRPLCGPEQVGGQDCCEVGHMRLLQQSNASRAQGSRDRRLRLSRGRYKREEWLVLHEVLLFPGDVECAVAARAAQHTQTLAQRNALAAVGADAVLGHAGKARGILGPRHDRPAARRLAHDLQVRARDAHALADDIHDGLARPQLLDVVPGTAAQRIFGLGPQPGPEASGSHLPLLTIFSATPSSTAGHGWRRAGRPCDRVGARWSMDVAIIALHAGGAL